MRRGRHGANGDHDHHDAGHERRRVQPDPGGIGRPHIHFEVYPSLPAATSAANKVATWQIALPNGTNDLVYATAGYEASVANQAQVSLGSDMVFSDGSSLELATITGSVAAGLTASLTVAV